MSGQLECLSVRWTVEVPRKPPWPESESFQLGEDELYLNCLEYRGKTIFLNLMCPDDSPFEDYDIPFYCTVSVENSETERILFKETIRVDDIEPTRINRFQSYRINLWQMQTKDIKMVDFSFDRERELSFLLTWGTKPLSDSNPVYNHMSVQTSEFLNPSPETSSTSFSAVKYSTNDASVQTEASSQASTNQSLMEMERLLGDFEKLWDGDSNADVELHCEDHIIKAHKAILCVRCPVLETMLQTEMIEGRTGVVKIQDMEADTFHSFIRYLYTGKLDGLTFDSAMRLYEAGDMYRVEGLARRCSQYLIDNLTVKNSCHILIIADAHSDSSFVDAVIAYMVQEKVPMSGDDWKIFCDTHSKLANNVLSRMFEMFLK